MKSRVGSASRPAARKPGCHSEDHARKTRSKIPRRFARTRQTWIFPFQREKLLTRREEIGDKISIEVTQTPNHSRPQCCLVCESRSKVLQAESAA